MGRWREEVIKERGSKRSGREAQKRGSVAIWLQKRQIVDVSKILVELCQNT